MLDDDGGDVIAERRRPSPTAVGSEDLRLVAGSLAVRPEGLDQPRVHPLGDEDPAPLPSPGHVHGLNERRRTVVEGGVRHVHPGELAHHRLELEDDLEHAL